MSIRRTVQDLADSRNVQDLATWASRIELGLAFASAALLGGLLNILQEWLSTGTLNSRLAIFGALLLVLLVAAIYLWILARRRSLDLGVCLVIRRQPLENRIDVVSAMERSTRNWIPLEFIDGPPSSWTPGAPEGVDALLSTLNAPLNTSVGTPRVLLSVSVSDAVGFYLGDTLRPTLSGAEIQILTLPTASESWQPYRYYANDKMYRNFFENTDLINGTCTCTNKHGIGVVHARRSPKHSVGTVITSLVTQDIVCCAAAIHEVPMQPESRAPVSQAEALRATKFLRGRAHLLASESPTQHIDLAFTCGPEVGLLAGLILSGHCRWRVHEFNSESSRWERRWESA